VSGLAEKVKNFFGIDQLEDYEDEDEIDFDPSEDEYDYQAESSSSREEDRNKGRYGGSRVNSVKGVGMENPRSNVIGMGIPNGAAEVVIIEPQSFDEMPQVIQTLRDRRSVVLNLNGMAPEEAQRAVDFVAGGTYAMDGHQERIGESIFLFTPSCVKVSTLSGVVHDVPEVRSNQTRKQAPNPNWDADSRYAAQ
jgi:cell division inhibitor SepF